MATILPSEVPIVRIAGGSPDGRSNLKWNTYTIACIQAEYCHLNGIKKIAVAAHSLHMNRALWTYQKLGLEAVPAPVPKNWEDYHDSGLVHWSMRWKWMFWLRELGCRLWFLFTGKI